jgi:predicted HTH domain antitoxin
VTDTAIALDSEVHRATIAELDDATLDAMLDALRERRLRLAKDYEAKQREKDAARSVRVREMYNKQLVMVEKAIATADKALDKAADKLNKMRAFRLELEDES